MYVRIGRGVWGRNLDVNDLFILTFKVTQLNIPLMRPDIGCRPSFSLNTLILIK